MIRGLWRGESVARVEMNNALASHTIFGRVADVGGGREPNYFKYLKQEPGTTIEALDVSLNGIDFEKDSLPYDDGSVDTVLLCNVLEHIYNHKFLLSECRRVLSKNGKLLGFVPFMVGYHPDPHDFFRYSNEALERLFRETEFSRTNVYPIGGSPLMANLNLLVLSIPRPLRPALYLWYRFWDILYVRLRPRANERTPFGYVFEAHA